MGAESMGAVPDARLKLRPAAGADRALFLEYRNERDAVRYSRNVTITEDEHARWWVGTSDRRWVAETENGPVGTLRLSSDGAVSIVVVPEARGKGYGTRMLQLLVPFARELGYARVWAEVAPENIASQRAFLKAGWNPVVFEVRP